MVVVADATPLNVLIRAGFPSILEKLFDTIFIPPAVAEELTRPATPAVVRDWMHAKPPWLHIKAPIELDPGPPRNQGEREAISLAREIGADLFLADDRRARAGAQRLGIACAGTIGVLEAAAVKKLIELRDAIIALPADFRERLDPRLIEDALARDAARRDTA